jgi:hypothetical protein
MKNLRIILDGCAVRHWLDYVGQHGRLRPKRAVLIYENDRQSQCRRQA